MATWKEMSLENRKAAKQLLLEGWWRSSVSRSYYAAYCAVTSLLEGKITFAHEGNNPAHIEMPNLILNNLYTLPIQQRWEIKRAFGRLWAARVEADYVPTSYMDRNIALNAWRDAHTILERLGIQE